MARQLSTIACCCSRAVARQQRGAVAFEPGEELGPVDQAVLDHLGVARAQLTGGQAGQHVGVREHEARLVEDADQVFAVAGVDPGLTADRAVDLGEQRGRDLHVVEAAQQDRRGEAGDVADHPAAERDQRRLASDALRQDLVEQVVEPGHALGRLAGREHDPARRDPGRLQARFERAEMRGLGQMVVGHEAHRGRAEHGPELGARSLQQTRPDHDLVAAGPKIEVEAHGGGHGPLSDRAAGNAATIRSTTALIGPLPLSTTRSASA